MNILIMGPAGSGKGTMSELILKEYDIPHISTGDMLRENVKKGTELGMKAKSYMESGHLVPDDVIDAMVEERLMQPDCHKGYLLDGYPRTLVQAKAFEKISQKIGKPVQVVLELDVGFDILKDRITGRRVCRSCGAIYHIHNHPSKVEGICDRCGSELVQRKDDTVEQLKVRLQEHETNTRPVLDYYEKKGLILKMDASHGTEEIFEEVKKALGKIA